MPLDQQIRLKMLVLFVSLAVVVAMQSPNAAYAVKNLNVTITLNQNSSAQVTELYVVVLTNQSISQYSTNRAALNLTLSNWQQLVGPTLVEHVLSTSGSVYNFKFLPGPVTTNQYNQRTANIILSYYVSNVTLVNETAPRLFNYKFNPKVFNFEHGVSGELLAPNTTLTIVMPQGSQIQSIYPIPDLPVFAFSNQYRNITTVSWLNGEPLTKFTLVFTIRQSIGTEVSVFFSTLYRDLGIFTYIIIAGAVVLSILYVYRKSAR